MAQFEANNTVSESTQASPFLIYYGQNPHIGFEPPTTVSRPYRQRLDAAATNRIVDKMKDIVDLIREELTWTQALHQEYANRIR